MRRGKRRCRRQNQEIEQYAVHGGCSFPRYQLLLPCPIVIDSSFGPRSVMSQVRLQSAVHVHEMGELRAGRKGKRWDSTKHGTEPFIHSIIHCGLTIGFNVSSITELSYSTGATTTGSSIDGGSENLDRHGVLLNNCQTPTTPLTRSMCSYCLCHLGSAPSCSLVLPRALLLASCFMLSCSCGHLTS